MDAGVAFGEDGYTFAERLTWSGRRSTTPTSRSGRTARPPSSRTPSSSTGRWCWSWPGFGAAALAPVRQQAAARFAAGPSPDAPVLRAPGWAVAETASAAEPGAVMTWAEANELLHATTALGSSVVMVPSVGGG